MTMLPVSGSQLAAVRRSTIREIKKLIRPYLRKSGFRTPIDPKKGIFGGTRSLLLWTPANDKTWKIRGSYVLEEIEGITEGGPITDSYCAIVVTDWNSLPCEDLLKLRDWVKHKMIPAAEKEQLPKAA